MIHHCKDFDLGARSLGCEASLPKLRDWLPEAIASRQPPTSVAMSNTRVSQRMVRHPTTNDTSALQRLLS